MTSIERDLVERLRKSPYMKNLTTEAADALASIRAERDEAVAALMSIIDAAIEDGFDPDEDGPLLDKIRSELKAIPPSPQPHTGRAGVTEALWDALAWIDTFDPETVAAAETKFGIHVGKRALNAALTVEPEAGEVTRK
jgi:hypothetical protein